MNRAIQIDTGHVKTEVTDATWVSYRCEPPYLGEHAYVRISAAYVLGEPETYIFPANASGKVTDWGELDDSFKGACDIARALEAMGYEDTAG